MSLLDDIKRALGMGGPERIFEDYAGGVAAGLGAAGLGAVGGGTFGAMRPRGALPDLEAAAPGLAEKIRGSFDVEPGQTSHFDPSTKVIYRGLGSDIGDVAHEASHARGSQGAMRGALQSLYRPRAAYLGGTALALGAGLSGNETAEQWAPLIGAAPTLPILAEEGAAAIHGTRILGNAARNANVDSDLRRKALRAMRGKSALGFLSYLAPALGIAGAGYAAPRVADWMAER